MNMEAISKSIMLYQILDRLNGDGSSSTRCNTISRTGELRSGAVQKTILTHAICHIQPPDQICLAGLVGQRWIVHWCENSMGNRIRFCVSRNAARFMWDGNRESEKEYDQYTHIDGRCQSVTIDLASMDIPFIYCCGTRTWKNLGGL